MFRKSQYEVITTVLAKNALQPTTTAGIAHWEIVNSFVETFSAVDPKFDAVKFLEHFAKQLTPEQLVSFNSAIKACEPDE